MTTKEFSITGNVVDIINKQIFTAKVTVAEGKIKSITPIENKDIVGHGFILPGFIDSHVHIESSMLVPSEFAKLAVVHGTVATISDPHEIANVCGMQGVEFMIDNGKQVNFKFNFGAPSCVPATSFETAGASLDSNDVEQLLQREEILYLSEMMNFPGVLFKDEEVMKKIAAAQRLGKPIDGHAPGLMGEKAKQYIEASLNPSKGGTLKPDNASNDYLYQTADPIIYGLLKTFVERLRSNATNAEIALWQRLRDKQLQGYKFRRQHIIGTFIADFVCISMKLVIEIDGAIHQLPDNIISDEQRTEELKKMGFSVIRFTNDEVLFKIDEVLTSISEKIKEIAISEAALLIPPLEGGGAVAISTDHECFTKEEALDKLGYGMKIIIREGSAAKNFEALIDLLHNHADNIMFCSDDKHPDSLAIGHINQLCVRAVAKGIDVFKVLQAACINPVKHYKMKVGLLQENDAADFIVVEDLQNFKVQQTFINGELVAENGKSFIKSVPVTTINKFECDEVNVELLKIIHPNSLNKSTAKVAVIEALDGQLITNKIFAELNIHNGELMSDVQNDILKMVVVNRYYNAPIAKCFIKNFGLQHGAMASSVAHDSHNIVAVGVDDESLARAINLVIKEKGGVSAVASSQHLNKEDGQVKERVLGLPVAGLMSADDGYKVATAYTAIDTMTKEDLGSTLIAPFMTLSFMALLVIPHLKLSDKGLFDGDKFDFTSLIVE